MKMYAVQATVERSGRSIQLPTFYLHPDVQGIISREQAGVIALDIIEPPGVPPANNISTSIQEVHLVSDALLIAERDRLKKQLDEATETIRALIQRASKAKRKTSNEKEIHYMETPEGRKGLLP